MSKLGKMIIYTTIVLFTVIILIGGINKLLKEKDRKELTAIGEVVSVNGKNIHIYSEGVGDKTIVLMSGQGIIAPAMDFSLLIDELKDEYKVVVVEYFGYGLSDESNEKRSCENIIEETREALKAAKIEGPYILMPHSLSGLYSKYYAAKYPKEIEGIINLDTAVASLCIEEGSNNEKSNTFINRVVNNIYNFLGTNRFNISDLEKEYRKNLNLNEDKLKTYEYVYNYSSYNVDLMNEKDEVYNNAKTVQSMKLPKELAVLTILGEENVEMQKEFNIDWIKIHEDDNKGLINSKCIVVKGHHDLYITNSKEVASEAKKFIKKYIK